jgi:hypothetical protein
MEIKNYASALRCVNYALMDAGVGDEERKTIKEKMEVLYRLSNRSVRSKDRQMLYHKIYVVQVVDLS